MATSDPVHAPPWADASEGRHYQEVAVTGLVSGQRLSLPVHWVKGHHAGPTLGILAVVHGDESFPPIALGEFLDGLDAVTARLHGVVVAIPVANPLALGAFSRFTPEHHGNPDLHASFPGKWPGSLTQMLAATITRHLLNHVDALVDIHSGGTGGRLQGRADFDVAASGPVRDASLRLCRAFGLGFVHENDLSGTAARYTVGRGKPAIDVELGGPYLGPAATRAYTARLLSGLHGVLKALEMVRDDSRLAFPRQLHFGLEGRVEVNPTVGGFLRSYFERPEDIGRRVTAGTVLGEVVSPHTLRVVETLAAPVDGYLFFSRYSGMVEAGSKAFALANEAQARWLESTS